MASIKIDNMDYDIDTLSDEAKAQLQSLQFCDAELARLQAQAAVLQTARAAYSTALKAALPVKQDTPLLVDDKSTLAH
ncbi:MAG: DUF6447 family protein [Polaromonas sp.]|nr:DUF6447 family protein [Polaromonas sp.]